MKPTMLLALSFLHFALTTVAQQIPATVLDINGEPVLTGAQYYIGRFYNESFHVAGPSGGQVYLYDEFADGKPVIISQGNRSEVVVDTALEIRFNGSIYCVSPPYWKVVLESPYFVTIGGCLEGYTFELAKTESSDQYYLTYSTTSPFCYNLTTVDIGPLDNYLVANATTTFQFLFLPANETLGIRTPPPKWMNLLRTTY